MQRGEDEGLEALFNSVEGVSLTGRLCEVLGEALALADHHRVDAHAMVFAFTEARVADALVALARHPRGHVRLVTDWTQLPDGGGRQPPRLAALAEQEGLERLEVRFKKDSPYAWDDARGAVVFRRAASRGVNHHKLLLVLVDGQPWRMLAGSFNWSRSAEVSNLENLVVFDGATPANAALMRHVEREFEAFRADGRATLSWREALDHERLLAEQLEARARGEAVEAVGGAEGRVEPLSLLAPAPPPTRAAVNVADAATLEALGASPAAAAAIVEHRALFGPFPRVSAVALVEGVDAESWAALAPLLDAALPRVAFSARRPDEAVGDGGYAATSEAATLTLPGPGGLVDEVPATLAAAALAVIEAARPGERLLLAAYGLGPNTPEARALAAAARRGVVLRVLLERAWNDPALLTLRALDAEPGTDVDVRVAERTMHQKFLVHPEGPALFNGSANLSGASAERNSEDRFLFQGCPALTAAFIDEFHRLWQRGSPPPPLPRVVLDHRIARVVTEPVTTSAGVQEYLRFHFPDWVNIAPVTTDGQLVLVRQLRWGIRAPTLEIPGGMVDPGEDPAESALRELLEETGYGGGTLQALGWVWSNPAIQDNRTWLFAVDGVRKLGEPVRGPGEEDLEVVLRPLDTLPAMLAEGEVDHALAVVTLQRLLLAR